jgi:hypothetical protein
MSIETKVARIHALQAVVVALISASAVIIPVVLSQRSEKSTQESKKSDTITVEKKLAQKPKSAHKEAINVNETGTKSITTPAKNVEIASKKNPLIDVLKQKIQSLEARLSGLINKLNEQLNTISEEEKYTLEDKLAVLKGIEKKLNIDAQTLSGIEKKSPPDGQKLLKALEGALQRLENQLNSYEK